MFSLSKALGQFSLSLLGDSGSPVPQVQLGSGQFILTGNDVSVTRDQAQVLGSGMFSLLGADLEAKIDQIQVMGSGQFVLEGSLLAYSLGLAMPSLGFELTGGELIADWIPPQQVEIASGVFRLRGMDLYQDPPLARPLDTGVFRLSGSGMDAFTYGNPQVGQLAAYIATLTPPQYRVGQLSTYIVYQTVPNNPLDSGLFTLTGGPLTATLLQQEMGTGSFAVEGGALGAAIVPEYIVGAWGLRRLVDSYAGPLIRVRDTDDDSEFDVGQDGQGRLLPVSTVGDAAVVRIYDQSKYGSDLVQVTASRQPLLVQNVTPKGGPAIKFDGVNDLIEDPVWATDRPYLVAQPSVWLGIGMSTPNVNWGIIYCLSHDRNSTSTPYARMSLGLDSSSPFICAARTNGTETRNLVIGGIRRELGWNFLAHTAALGLVQNGIDEAKDESTAVAATVTYPNPSNFMLGRNVQTAPYWGGYFVEAVMVDNGEVGFSASQIKEELVRRKRDVLTVGRQLWRLRITDNFNYGVGDRTSCFSQLIFNAGGVPLTVANQPAFASHRNTVNTGEQQLFTTSNTSVWVSGDVPGPHYVGVDFGQAQTPEELVLVSRQIDGSENQNLMPRLFDVQYMDDSGNWVTVKSVDLTSEGVASAKTYTVDLT